MRSSSSSSSSSNNSRGSSDDSDGSDGRKRDDEDTGSKGEQDSGPSPISDPAGYMRKFISDYGPVGLATHLSLSVLWFGGAYVRRESRAGARCPASAAPS